jgi:NADH-dependent peroxiredoxin subunit F
MSEFFDDKTKKELKTLLGKLQEPVTIIYFTQPMACPMCREQEKILKEFVAFSPKLKLEIHDFVKDTDKVLQFRIDKIPATVVMGKKDYGIRLYGVTAGYEFTSLLEAVMMISTGKSGLRPELEQLIRAIDTPVHLQVMVTLTCPYCPQAVHVGQQMAFVNDTIRCDMVESSEFPQVAQYYQVQGVPKTIINEINSFEGALPAESFYLEVLKAVKPEEYQKIENAIREAQGERRVKPADEKTQYEVIVLGGGPAAMSAAIYTARKDLDVLLVTKDIGGQITFTARVDNYLGLPGLGGKEMATHFRYHMEQYPIAEALGKAVEKVEKKDEMFVVTLEGGQTYRGNSVIYCAGKEYRRLGVPNEEPFIGKGIAFCATCDAPLYRGRRVAVVGGGNSAFTSVRDLLPFASEVHLIHRREAFTADPLLIDEVKSARNLTMHQSTVVREVLGREKLTGLRLVSNDGSELLDLPVDGVFLEIGLTPRSEPVKDLLPLTEFGEIPVNKDNSTTLPGFYAAGDVTDVEEKQISISVGDGAKAALAAHKYLLDHRLTRSLVAAGSEWQ